MTGFGAGRAAEGDRIFTIEARSVNHRFCDVRVHLPHDFAQLESRLEAETRKKVDRGRVDVSLEVSYAAGAVARPEVDIAKARGYHDALLLLAKELHLEPEIRLQTIADMPGVIRSGESALDPARLGDTLSTALEAALAELVQMREREGRALDEELRARLTGVKKLLEQIRTEIPRANTERRTRLEQRLGEMLTDRNLDPGRIAQEVAILIDRADVAEELTRLASHIAQLENLFGLREPIGRKLDFLLQEMNREANTIGSKTMNAPISHLVVDLKAELERMREQIQNVE